MVRRRELASLLFGWFIARCREPSPYSMRVELWPRNGTLEPLTRALNRLGARFRVVGQRRRKLVVYLDGYARLLLDAMLRSYRARRRTRALDPEPRILAASRLGSPKWVAVGIALAARRAPRGAWRFEVLELPSYARSRALRILEELGIERTRCARVLKKRVLDYLLAKAWIIGGRDICFSRRKLIEAMKTMGLDPGTRLGRGLLKLVHEYGHC